MGFPAYFETERRARRRVEPDSRPPETDPPGGSKNESSEGEKFLLTIASLLIENLTVLGPGKGRAHRGHFRRPPERGRQIVRDRVGRSSEFVFGDERPRGTSSPRRPGGRPRGVANIFVVRRRRRRPSSSRSPRARSSSWSPRSRRGRKRRARRDDRQAPVIDRRDRRPPASRWSRRRRSVRALASRRCRRTISRTKTDVAVASRDDGPQIAETQTAPQPQPQYEITLEVLGVQRSL